MPVFVSTIYRLQFTTFFNASASGNRSGSSSCGLFFSVSAHHVCKKNCRIFAKGVFLSFQSKTEMSSRSSSLDNDNLQAPLYKLQAQMPDHVSARHQTFDKIGLKFHKFLPHFQSTNNSFFATCTRGLFLRGESHTLMS
jgi:hypothetical protein